MRLSAVVGAEVHVDHDEWMRGAVRDGTGAAFRRG